MNVFEDLEVEIFIPSYDNNPADLFRPVRGKDCSSGVERMNMLIPLRSA
jgi:hypothetical protein